MDSKFAQIELTDGWYGVTGVLDGRLTAMLQCGKIHVGMKLRVFGAQVWPCMTLTST